MFGAGPEPEPGSWGAVRGQRLPEILTLEEFRRMLAVAYHADSRNGLVLRLLFETAVQVSELSRLDVPDIELAERTLGIRHGKGAKGRLVVFTQDLEQLLQVHLGGASLVSERLFLAAPPWPQAARRGKRTSR